MNNKNLILFIVLIAPAGGCTDRNPSYLNDGGATSDRGTRPDVDTPVHDGPRPDLSRLDLSAGDISGHDQGRDDRQGPDLGRTDLGRTDLKVQRDLPPPPIRAISTARLLKALKGIKIRCVKADGVPSTESMPIIDRAEVHYWDDAAADQWDPKTVAWIGGHSSVVVVIDPNACDQEDPVSGDDNWQSAGIVIRKAILRKGMLLLDASTTVADMNVVEGSFVKAHDVEERFLPDDSQIPVQLVGTFTAAKKAILSLSR